MSIDKIVDNRPDWLKSSEVGKGTLTFEGQRYSYTIASKNLEPRLSYFVGFPRGECLFISEEVPERYRFHMMAHEIMEFTHLRGQPGRCRLALLRELSGVPIELKADYIQFRLQFFENLVNFYKDTSAGPLESGFKEEINESLQYLKAFAGQ